MPSNLDAWLRLCAEERARALETRDKPGACCKLAVPIPCVCAYAYKCSEHGETHVGTHD